ncbi:MAG: S9 family peptidase [Chloroflexi bacterium]|nr:S9 family peptidase [Chloroflexota bacterium]
MTSQKPTQLPFGLWPSPITAALISQRLRFDDVQWAGADLVWLESRSGKSVLISLSPGGERRELTDEPAPRGGVGYGGGDFTASKDTILFAARDGRIFRRGLGFEPPRPITPTVAGGSTASPVLSPDGNWVVYIYSDGKIDLLAIADSSGRQWPAKLAQGADFYMQPAWHPAGDRLAWVEWDAPNMPWDGTRVQLARLEMGQNGAAPRILDVQTAGGGVSSAAQQPEFSPDGRYLSFIEENGEWDDLVLLDLQTGERRALVKGDGFELSRPAWSQGIRSYVWSGDSRQIYHTRYAGPNASLWVTDVETGQSTRLDTGPYTYLSQLSVNAETGELAFIASAPDRPEQIVVLDKNGISVKAHSAAAMYDPAFLPEAKEISWPAPDGTKTFGLYYPPSSPRYSGMGLPPAIVHIHGGPTSIAPNRFNAEAAYFTSRGYAYVEVNYRGSTGYGRTYRNALRQRWGDVDVEDAAGCARALAEQKLADPNRLVITGGSAGGYTVLNTLIRYPGLYKAGVCLYGVSNLFMLNMDTHKFEAHYNDLMVGMLPEAAGRFHDWSPVFHAGKIKDALYIFQGSEDRVVPPNQAEAVMAALREKGIPHQYKVYEGEGHGFRKSETIVDYLKETERFLQQHVLFAK